MARSAEAPLTPQTSGSALFAAIARATPMSMLGHVANVTLAVVAFRSHVDPMLLLLWAVGSYFVAALVLARWMTRRGRLGKPTNATRSRAPRRAVFFGAVLAAPWGIIGFWLLGELPQQQELILIALCIGMSASGSVLLSATYPSAVTYMACILAPVVLKCFFILNSSEYYLLGALTISYSLFLLNCIRSCAKLFTDRNRAVEELSRSLQATEAAKCEIERANIRFEAALRNMPQGLSMFDGDDRLVAFNRQFLDIYGLSPETVSIGMKFNEVFADRTLIPDIDEHLRELKRRVSMLGCTNSTVTFPDGRVIYISYGYNHGGGWVATHEDISQRKAFERKIELLAHFDALTDLANRNLFRERLDEALARHRQFQTRFAVMLLDLDKFKAVNDALGHYAGDMLLRLVADRIRASLREADIAARLGGDEFGLIVELGQDWSVDTVIAFADRLIETIGSSYVLEGHSVAIGCSVGVAVVPDHGIRFDEVLRNADLALYKSKHSGRNRSHLYSESLQAEVERRNRLELELRDAIWREQLEVHYQPIFDLKTGEVALVEALARWNHPAMGVVSPEEFISVAEESGLIVELGRLVLRKACRDASRMPAGVKVAVNLSPVQFSRGDLVDSVTSALEEARLDQSRLELEITEGVFLEENERNLKTLERLKDIGVSIALDDFGVGYSSLSYLTAFAFNKVKIDRSFMDRFDKAETQTVIVSIVQLAKSLKLSVVAEGVETEAQMAKLHSLGVDFGQGYLLGRPKPAAELEYGRYRADEGVLVA